MAVTTAVAAFDLNESVWKFSDDRLIQVPAVVTPTLDMARQNQVQGDGLQFFWEQSNRTSVSDVDNVPSFTGTTIQVAAGEAVLFAEGDVIQPIDNSGVVQSEYMLVTAVDVNNNNLTVTRGYVSTTPVDILSSWQVRRVYASMKADASVYSSTRALWLETSNYFQRIFRKRTITEDFERLSAFNGTQFEHEVMVATAEVVEDLYRAVTVGKCLGTSPQGGVTTYPAMNGFNTAWALSTGTWPNGTPDSTAVSTFALLLTFLRDKSYARNKGHDTLIFGTTAASTFYALSDFLRALATGEECAACQGMGHAFVDKLRTPYGTYKIQINEYIPSTYIYAVQSTDIALVVSEPIQMTLLSKPDNGTAFRVGGIFTMRYTDLSLWAVASTT